MKVIIKKTGEVKKVALGYAVNYLLPKGLAEIATKEKLAELKKQKAEAADMKKASLMENRREADRFDGKVIELKVKAGKAGKVHGRTTKKEIAKEVGVLKANVVLEKPIKKVGEYEVELVFGKAKAKIKVKVTAEEEKKKKEA